MSPFEIGIVVPLAQSGPDRTVARWQELREIALRAEALGFDTIWTPDELLWQAGRTDHRVALWDGRSMAGAVAVADRTRAKVGTWVHSPRSTATRGSSPRPPRRSTSSAAGGSCSAWVRVTRGRGRRGRSDCPQDHHLRPRVRRGARDHRAAPPRRPRRLRGDPGMRPGAWSSSRSVRGPAGSRCSSGTADSNQGQRHGRPSRGHPQLLRGGARHAWTRSEPRSSQLEAICEELGRDPATYQAFGRRQRERGGRTGPVSERGRAVGLRPSEIADGLRALP